VSEVITVAYIALIVPLDIVVWLLVKRWLSDTVIANLGVVVVNLMLITVNVLYLALR
jgi:hypothetical protein